MIFHVNSAHALTRAFDSGKPLAALCGYTRTMTAEEHDRTLREETIEQCPECTALHQKSMRRGFANPLPDPPSTAEQIRETAKAEGDFSAAWTFRFDGSWMKKAPHTTNRTSGFPLAA